MNPVGYPLLIVGGFLVRQTFVGRARDSAADAKDLSLAFLQGDMSGVSTVFGRRGASTTSAGGSEVATPPAGALVSGPSLSGLTGEVQALGSKARGYRLGATGPDYYDCSGLIWRAMHNLDLYKGGRFTTSSFANVAKLQGWKMVSSPVSGDIVLWSGSHMGVATGNDGMYSARSTAKGIGPSTISGDSSYFGAKPLYFRIG
jgi:cell wall-associated NlpC family hydrolase